MSGYLKDQFVTIKQLYTQAPSIFNIQRTNFNTVGNTLNGALTIDFSLGDIHTIGVSAAGTLTFSNPNKTSFILIFANSSGGSRNITFPSAVWSNEGLNSAKIITIPNNRWLHVSGFYNGSIYFLSYTEFYA